MEHVAKTLSDNCAAPDGCAVETAVRQPLSPVVFVRRRGRKKVPVAILNTISGRLNQILLWIGGVSLLVMIVLTCGNIVLRILWTPVKGTFELMSFFSAIVASFALGHTQTERGHTGIDLVVNLFSMRTRRTLNRINHLILTAFFCVLGWQLISWGTTLRRAGEVTETLGIVFYPFVYGVGVGFFGPALVLLVELLTEFSRKKGV